MLIVQHLVKRPLADDKTFLQGVDFQGRALAIIRVKDHHSKTRSLKEMYLFSSYIMDAMVRNNSDCPSHGDV